MSPVRVGWACDVDTCAWLCYFGQCPDDWKRWFSRDSHVRHNDITTKPPPKPRALITNQSTPHVRATTPHPIQVALGISMIPLVRHHGTIKPHVTALTQCTHDATPRPENNRHRLHTSSLQYQSLTRWPQTLVSLPRDIIRKQSQEVSIYEPTV